jgi:glycerol-3-phosphate dehydrogenase
MADDAGRMERRPARASGRVYDVIVVGGGIYGAFVALEAGRAGLRALLLERDDFGGAASGSSLRIAHGGLRYLQSLDLRRFRRSFEERDWLRMRFPHLVHEMGCLMPLYGEGAKRPALVRAALRINDFGVRSSGRGTLAEAWPRSRVLGRRTSRELFPAVSAEGLRGSAFWYDGFIRSTPRLLMEVLRWSSALGGTALNYVEAIEVQVRGGRVRGVRARDRASGRELVFRAPAVVNAAGASIPHLAATAGAHAPELFRPTLAFNVLLRRPPLSDQALALSPRHEPGSRTFFMVPWNGRILAGTWHGPRSAAVDGDGARAYPTERALADFLDGLNRAAPGLDADREHVARVYAGFLPGGSENAVEPRRRARIVHHADRGEAAGLVTVSGVKYTTARRVAEETVRGVVPRRPGSRIRRSTRLAGLQPPQLSAALRDVLLSPAAELLRTDPARVAAALTELVRNEAVVQRDDLLLRRTDWGADPAEGRDVARFLAPLLEEIPEWTRARKARDALARAEGEAGAVGRAPAGARGVGPAA